MPVMHVILEGDVAWTDLARKAPELVTWLGNEAPPIQVAALAQGMTSGAPSVAIRLDLPFGRVVVAETSLALFLTAADAFKARYGDPRQGRP